MVVAGDSETRSQLLRSYGISNIAFEWEESVWTLGERDREGGE